MASESQDWVEDVRRWYFSGVAGETSNVVGTPPVDDDAAVGYEAAQPALVHNWPDRAGQ